MSMLALAGMGCNLGHHLQRLVGGEGAHIEDFVECGVHKSGPILDGPGRAAMY